MVSRVVVLGGTGMLGSAIIEVLSEQGIPYGATTRDLAGLPPGWVERFSAFDALTGNVSQVVGELGPGDHVVNCVGVIRHHISDASPRDRRNAIAINAMFPYALVDAAERQGFHITQIATDCVYSGSTGRYDEDSAHDATDVYGQTKSLGEVPSPSLLNLRCSIIGPELKNKVSLLEWVLSHNAGSSFSGYTDHLWNGVTARAFARVFAGIVTSQNLLSGTYHLVPADAVDKSTLSRLILDEYGRTGVDVVPTATGNPVDRTLATRHPDISAQLWQDAGYQEPPTIQEMVHELACHYSHNTEGNS